MNYARHPDYPPAHETELGRISTNPLKGGTAALAATQISPEPSRWFDRMNCLPPGNRAPSLQTERPQFLVDSSKQGKQLHHYSWCWSLYVGSTSIVGGRG